MKIVTIVSEDTHVPKPVTPEDDPRTQRSNKKRLARVMAYTNVGVVERIQKKRGLSISEAEQLFRDTLAFLFLASVSRKKLAPTRNVDAGWHEFLMFTRDYADFCRTYLGVFVHHSPRTSLTVPLETENLASTFDLARKFLGSGLSKNWQFDPEMNADCSPDTGGGGNECCPDYD